MDRVRRAAAKSLLGASLFLPQLISSIANANDFEGAGAYYSENNLTALMLSLTDGVDTRRLFSGPGRSTEARLGYTGKEITFKNPGNLLLEQTGGKTNIQENDFTASIDQGVQIGTRVGLLAGITESPLSDSRYLGARVSQWWLDETLQTNFDLRQTKVKQPPVAFTDTDGKRVVTPEDLDGTNASVTVTNMTTPTTILRGAYSLTERSDRPPAWSLSAEIRQFITPTRSAVHASLTHYENVGFIQPDTLYGSVMANSARLEWHQHLPRRLILMGGYRYYIEDETPRAADSPRQQVGSDSIYGSLRWRLGNGAWTADASELYAFAAHYTSNVPNSALLIGLGGRYLY